MGTQAPGHNLQGIALADIGGHDLQVHAASLGIEFHSQAPFTGPVLKVILRLQGTAAKELVHPYLPLGQELRQVALVRYGAAPVFPEAVQDVGKLGLIAADSPNPLEHVGRGTDGEYSLVMIGLNKEAGLHHLCKKLSGNLPGQGRLLEDIALAVNYKCAIGANQGQIDIQLLGIIQGGAEATAGGQGDPQTPLLCGQWPGG